MLSESERDFDTVITERAGQAMEMTRDLDISRLEQKRDVEPIQLV